MDKVNEPSELINNQSINHTTLQKKPFIKIFLPHILVAIVVALLSIGWYANYILKSNSHKSKAAEVQQNAQSSEGTGFTISGEAINSHSFKPASCGSAAEIQQEMDSADSSKVEGDLQNFTLDKINEVKVTLDGFTPGGEHIQKTTYTTDTSRDDHKQYGVFLFYDVPNGTFQVCQEGTSSHNVSTFCTSQGNTSENSMGTNCNSVVINNADSSESTTFIFNQ
ncbi:MAG: hypothetical protein ABIO02_01545 [Patescibacteria group bacterium]